MQTYSPMVLTLVVSDGRERIIVHARWTAASGEKFNGAGGPNRKRIIFMKIICGTDFSAHANDAALAAAALTGRVQGGLTLVHVLDANLYRDPSPELMNHLRDGRQRKMNALVERAKRRAAKAEARVVEGNPAVKLAELANTTKAQMLIVSSNGQIAASKWFVGSVADQVVQNSLVPTLVLRKAGVWQDWIYAKRNLRVLIGYDFSASAEAALHWAAGLRRIAPCDITVAYVASAANERARLGIAPAMSPLYYPAGVKKFLEAELKQKCAAVLGPDGVKTCVKADWGRPDSRLLELAADDQADLIVVGTSQRRGLARLGSISRAVLHYAHMNVACIPAPRDVEKTPVGRPQFERVLVPIDFSESAAPAVALACATVGQSGEVRLLHVVPPEKLNGHPPRIRESHSESSQRLADRMTALVPKSTQARGIKTQAVVVEHNEPATAICQIADTFNADLICMAARKRPWLLGTIYGSVSQRVMGRSRCPVLITPEPKHESDDFTADETLTKRGG